MLKSNKKYFSEHKQIISKSELMLESIEVENKKTFLDRIKCENKKEIDLSNCFGNKSKSKAQISLEIIMIISLALIFFIMIFVFYNSKFHEYNYTKERIIAKQIVNSIVINANQIASSSEGTKVTIYVPKKINNKNYTLSIRDNILEIKWDGNYYTYPFNTFKIQLNKSQRSNYTIAKFNNTVFIGEYKECIEDRHCKEDQTCSDFLCT